MFVGHFAVALTAKQAAPKTSLGTLVLAAQLLDLMWPMFLLVGMEHARIDPGNTVVTPLDFYDYPISHSLLMVLVWAAVLAGIYLWQRGYSRGAWVVGLAVVSHWVLDVVTHRPDLPLAPGVETYVGLGLWNSRLATLLVEGLLFASAVLIYRSSTRALDKQGSGGFWAYVAFLFMIWLGNLYGPAPENMRQVAYAGVAMWLLVAWAYWIDRHRESLLDSAK